MTSTPLSGVLVVDKPTGPSSTQVLNHIKYRLKKTPFGNGRKTKIGHAGTLDPLASGVLVVLLGRATKIAPWLTGQQKHYVGELELGKVSDTWDNTGEVIEPTDASRSAGEVSREEITQAVLDWKADTVQEVPAYSAAKHQGTPLYALARRGLDTPVKTKPITIFGSEVVHLDPPYCVFRVRTSAGTYVRSLVHSLGMRLGCGAVMTALRREASGVFDISQAMEPDALLALLDEDPDGFAARVLDVSHALAGVEGLQRIRVQPDEAAQVLNGIWLPAPTAREGDTALLLTEGDAGDEALAMVEARPRAEGNGPHDLGWSITRGLW